MKHPTAVAAAAPARAPIALASMPQLAEARDGDEDWTGLADPAARRRLQCKLNMRAYRRRRARQTKEAPDQTPGIIVQQGSAQVRCWDEATQQVIYLAPKDAKSMTVWSGGKAPLKKGSTQPSRIIFPLSSDHLITLIQINVMRAIIVNSHLLSIDLPMGARDCTHGSIRTKALYDCPKTLPPNLSPTHLQSTIPHGQWVDVFPHPRWRDNFLRALGTFDEMELCRDLVGWLFPGGSGAKKNERQGVVVWSPPWSHDGWELSEGFVKKWGWTIEGCEDILEATNRYRLARGEKPLRMCM